MKGTAAGQLALCPRRRYDGTRSDLKLRGQQSPLRKGLACKTQIARVIDYLLRRFEPAPFQTNISEGFKARVIGEHVATVVQPPSMVIQA